MPGKTRITAGDGLLFYGKHLDKPVKIHQANKNWAMLPNNLAERLS